MATKKKALITNSCRRKRKITAQVENYQPELDKSLQHKELGLEFQNQDRTRGEKSTSSLKTPYISFFSIKSESTCKFSQRNPFFPLLCWASLMCLPPVFLIDNQLSLQLPPHPPVNPTIDMKSKGNLRTAPRIFTEAKHGHLSHLVGTAQTETNPTRVYYHH